MTNRNGKQSSVALQRKNYEALWKQLVGTTVPVSIKDYNRHPAGLTFVDVAVPLIDKRGNEVSKLVCRGEECRTHQYAEVIILDEPFEEGQSPYCKVLRELDKEEFISQRTSRQHISLQKAIDDFKSKTTSIEEDVEKRVAEATAKALNELDEERKKLATSRDKLDSENAKLEKKKAEIHNQAKRHAHEELKSRSKELDLKAQQLLREKELLNTRSAKLEKLVSVADKFKAQGGPEFMAIVRNTYGNQDLTRSTVISTSPPDNLFQKATARLSKSGYFVSELLLVQFVLSTVTAAASGQLVLLSGQTGVGKTSLVDRMRRILGAGPEEDGLGIVPVRPAWLDPTDLLGFYNPTTKEYEPTPFIDELVNAHRYSESGELYFLVLDEMNLAKIEDYGADFLSKMEKSREAIRLSNSDSIAIFLYAESINQRQQLRLKDLVNKRRQVTNESSQADQIDVEISSLSNQILQTPSRMNIPSGLVVFGTLNVDETTHSLSPKVIDRSFILQVPTSGLPDNPSIGSYKELEKLWTLSQDFLLVVDSHSNLPEWAEMAWVDILNWYEEYLYPLDVHLSRRFSSLYAYYMTTASLFGLPNVNINKDDIISGFLMAKVLPWISFHEDERARGSNTKKKDILANWIDSDVFKKDRYSALQNALKEIWNQAGLTYEYLR